MSQLSCIAHSRVGFGQTLLMVLCAGVLLSISAVAYCDDPVAMAPPVPAGGAPAANSSTTAAANVFNWQEVPENQNVPIEKATFDKGGYQIYDTVGETIVVPFTDNNLYVMKFAVSSDGTAYFVNTGTAPVLYLPQDGYLTNALDATDRWYPFTQQWQPTTPVYAGIAPSWDDYVDMGWYPDMYCYGGYWCDEPFVSFGAVYPAFGLFFDIGGANCYGWGPYRAYCGFHPNPFRIGFCNTDFYRWGGPGWQHYAGFNHTFFGTGHPFVAGRGFVPNAGRVFMGAGRPYVLGRGFVGGPPMGGGFRDDSAMGGNHFGGSMTGGFDRGFEGPRSNSENFAFHDQPSFSSGRAFQSAPGGFRSFGGSGFAGGYHSSGGFSHSFGGGGASFHSGGGFSGRR